MPLTLIEITRSMRDAEEGCARRAFYRGAHSIERAFQRERISARRAFYRGAFYCAKRRTPAAQAPLRPAALRGGKEIGHGEAAMHGRRRWKRLILGMRTPFDNAYPSSHHRRRGGPAVPARRGADTVSVCRQQRGGALQRQAADRIDRPC